MAVDFVTFRGKVGFSPRKANLTIYLLSGLVGYEDLLDRLGKHTRAKSCIYVKRSATSTGMSSSNS